MAKKAKIFELYEEYEKKRNKENAESSNSIFDQYREYEKRRNEENARNIPVRSESQTAQQTVDQLGNLGNMVKKTETETFPKITNEAVRNYNLSKVGRDYLSKYDDSTSYTDIQKDIEELMYRKGGAERRDNDTGVYDRAIAMLEQYANNNYSLNDNKTSYADKEAIYEDNKQIEEGLGEKSNSATDPMYRDYALMTWLGSYDHKGIKDSATNQAAIKSFNEATGEKGYDLSNELGELKDDEIASKADELRTYFQDKYGYKYNTDYLNAAQNFYSDLQNRYNKAKTDNKTYERTGEAAAYTADIVKKDDYADKSAVGDYGTPTTKEDIDEYLKNNQAVDYNNIQGFDSKNVDSLPDKLGSFLSAEDIKDQNTSSEFSPERKISINLQKTDNAWTHPFDTSQSGYDDLMTEGYNNGWDVINDEEKGTYYYIYNTEGKEAAYEYLNSLKNTLQKRKNYDNVKEATKNSADSGTLDNLDFILRSAASVPDNAFGGATGTLDNMAHYISGEDIEPYSSAHAAALSAAATREASGEALDEQFWHTDSPWGVNPSDIYGGVMSSADMLSSFAVGEVPYSALMGLSAAESTARDLYEQGEDNATIAEVSTASGIAEALFEKLSVEQIWNIANIDGAKTAKEIVKKYAYNMARAAGVEASEEIATEAANMVVDNIVRGSRSDTADASIEDIGSRLYKAGVGGAIGGLLGGGGATTLSAVAKSAEITHDKIERNKYIATTGANISNTGNIQNLIDKAEGIDNEDVQSQLAKVKQAQSGNNESKLEKEAGKLYSVMQKNNLDALDNGASGVVKAALREAYAKETGEDVTSDTVTKAADAIYKANYTNEPLNSIDKLIVSESASQKAYEAVKNDSSVTEKAVTAKQRAMNDLVSTAALTQEKEKPKSDNEVLNSATFDIHEDDGKVYTKDGQKQVDLASVSAVSDNDISFSLKNGETESLNNLDLPKQQAVLAQSIIDVQKDTGISLTPEAANTIFQGYDKVKDSYKSVGAYMLDARKVLFNGYTNNTAPDNTINLPQSLRNSLYSIGRQLSESSTISKQKAVRARINGLKTRKGAVSFRDGMSLDDNGKVSYEENGKTYKLDPMRQASVDFLSMTGESLGFDIVFYRSTKDGKGRFSSKYVTDKKYGKEGQQAPSGFWRGGKMYIDVNAGMNGEGLILFTASHELVHMIREGSPEDFKALADFLVQNYSEQGTDINDLIRMEMAKSTNLTRDEAYEEVIADACESFLRDTLINGKAKALYQENPTLWTKIKNALKTIIDRLKSLKPQSEASRKTLKLGIEKLETAYDLFTRGIERSAQNLRSMEGEKSQNSRYTFAGREANNADVGTLEEAQQMEEEGVDSEDIRQQTGWFKGLDGLWRFELDDSQMRIKDTEPRYGKLYLHEAIDYPQLFEAYPRLESFVVSYKDMPEGERGSWDASRRTIEINNKLRQDEDALTETLIHELQHAVQRIEGFAKGASPQYWYNAFGLGEDNRTIAEKKEASSRRRQNESEYNEAKQADPEFVERIERIDSTINSFVYDEATQEAWDKAQEDIKNLKEKYGEEKVNHFLYVVRSRRTAESTVGRMSKPFDLYQATAGEVEARDSASRRGYTAEQRRNIRPDVDREDVVFRPGDDANVKYQSREDADYLSAVERGDTETAQRMVDEAAKEAGYNTPVLYHGTQKFGFTQFDLNKMDDGMSIFLTSTEETASTYSGVNGVRNLGEKMRFDNDIDRMSLKDLVDTANRYKSSSEFDTEFKYYSSDDISKITASTADELQKLKDFAKKIAPEYAQKAMDDYDDNAYYVHSNINSLIDAIDKNEYAWAASYLGSLSAQAKEFDTDAYKKLYDSLHLLAQIEHDGVKGDVIIRDVDDGMFYQTESVQSLKNRLMREFNYGNYATYAKLDNPLVINARGSYWNRIPIPERIWSELPSANQNFYGGKLVSKTRAIALYAKDHGYDCVIFKNLNDDGGWNESAKSTVSDVYVVFDSAQVKSADPVTYDNDGNVIPLSERFNVSEQDIRYKGRIDINKALNPAERSSFYRSLMPNNQREFYRIGENAILVPNESENPDRINEYKLVFYDGDHVEYEITDVYKISNYEYNIHDNKPNAFEFLDAREKKLNAALSEQERRKIDDYTRAVLENSAVYFGTVFRRYNGKSNRFNVFARGGRKATSNNSYKANGTGVSNRAGQTGIKYLSDRDENQFQDFEISDWDYDDTTADTIAREYVSHHEDIGEVLKNIADIDITPAKVTAIVNRVLRENIGTLDKTTRELLSTEVQIALDRVNRDDPATVINNMTQAVRDAIENAYVPSEKAEADYKELLSVFKGKRFYLSEEQLNYLKEHDSSLGKIHRELQNRVNIVDKNNLKRSINGGYQNAQELSLEGLYDVLESPDEYLSYKRDEWDKYGYKAPFIIRDALNKLRDMRSQRITEVYSSNAIDDMAVTLSAKITGGIVEAKYNSRKNPYITKLVNDLKAKRSEAVKKQKEKYQKKLSELKQKERERAAKRERELSDKYKEQRERGRENRKRTEFRNKIRKLMNSFQSKLTKPRDGSYVPRELIAQTVDVLNSINMDTGRSVNLSEKIAALRNTYDGLRKDAEAQAIYNDTISEMLRGLSVAIKNTSIMDMSLEQLQMTYDALRSLDHYIRESVKMTDTEEKRSTHALGRAMIAETREASGGNKGILSGYVQAQLRADVMFNRLGGFKKNSTWLQMARMLNDGQLHMTQLQMEFSKIFADVLTDIKQLRTLSNTKNLVDIGLIDDDGKTVKITRGMMLSLYMHLLNEDNTRHVMGGGLTVPGIKEYYKGDLTKAFGEKQRSVRAGQIDFTEYAEGIKTVIEEQLTDYEKVWIGLAHEFFDDASRNAINDTTMKLYGFKRATVTNYFPIHTDSNYRAASFESITRDMSLENSGFMKERIKASNPILLEDIVDVINDQIQKVSKYCGLTIPINNFQKVYGTTLAGYESSLQKEINKKFSGSKSNTSATKYIDNLITDLTSGRQTSEGPFAKFFTAARGNLAKATLTINARVAIAQAASYPTAAAEIGWKPLLKAAVKGGRSNRMFSRADRVAIEEVSPLLWLRTQGYSNTEIGDIKELRKQKHKIEGKFKKAMGWIEFFDGMTVGRLYYAAQYAVDEKYPSLKRGTEEYKQKVAEVYNDIIEKTQPNYTVLQRPDILRNPNAVVKSLTMFMTQRLQNFNIVYDAAGTYNKYRKDFKSGKNGVTALDVKEAGTKLRRAVVSQVVASTTIVGMKLFADFLLHSLTGYRDDDDEVTAESVALALMSNFADTIFSSVLFGSDLYKLIMSVYKGDKFDGVSQSGIDSLKDMLSSVANVGSNVFHTIKGEETLNWEYFHTLGKQICLVFGIPLNNAEKIGKAVYYWTSDITSEKLFDSDVKRSNKQNIHRVETRMSAGDTEEAKEIVNAMIKDKISNGKTEKEAKQSVRTSFTQEYKPRYLEAVKNNNEAEIKNIRQLLLNTGVYGNLSDLDKSMAEWRKDLNKKE